MHHSLFGKGNAMFYLVLGFAVMVGAMVLFPPRSHVRSRYY